MPEHLDPPAGPTTILPLQHGHNGQPHAAGSNSPRSPHPHLPDGRAECGHNPHGHPARPYAVGQVHSWFWPKSGRLGPEELLRQHHGQNERHSAAEWVGLGCDSQWWPHGQAVFPPTWHDPIWRQHAMGWKQWDFLWQLLVNRKEPDVVSSLEIHICTFLD